MTRRTAKLAVSFSIHVLRGLGISSGIQTPIYKVFRLDRLDANETLSMVTYSAGLSQTRGQAERRSRQDTRQNSLAITN